MNLTDFTFPSADGKTNIHAVRWEPEGTPVGILQLEHGITEHIMRYDRFARYMAQRGVVVVGDDHIGHGLSLAPGASPWYFGPNGSWDFSVEDVKTLHDLTAAAYPDLPYCLLGHSLGSFQVRACLIRYPGMADAAVLMGTGQQSTVATLIGRAMANSYAKKDGEDRPSEGTKNLLFGNYNKTFAPNRTIADWLCASEAGVDDFLADPLCGEDVTPGLFRELMNGMLFANRGKHLKKTDPNCHVLFISGGDDPVGEMGKGVGKACAAFRRAGVKDVSLKLYPGLRHNLLDEDAKETVFQDIYDWLLPRMK